MCFFFQANQKKKIDKKKKTCMLYLQADHLFFKQMGSEEASIDVMTRHVQRVNSIYREIGKDLATKTNLVLPIILKAILQMKCIAPKTF